MPEVLQLAALPQVEGIDFEQLFDRLPDPAAYVGPDDRIRACNQSFRDRFPRLIENRFVEALRHEPGKNIHAGHVEPKRQSIAGGKCWPALRPSITELPSGALLVVFRPIDSVQLDYLQEIGGLRKQLRDAEEDTRAALDDVASYKMSLAHVGHELRTPLNAIVGFSDMMRQEMLGPLGDTRYQRYAEVVHGSGLRLLDLIDDILDFAKLDAGRLELCAHEVEILRVVVASIRELELLAAKSRVGISTRVCDAVSRITADEKRLRQMLTNLLSNALKFTPEGGEISIDIYKRGEKIAISVSDTGIGMREADIATALEPFGRINCRGKLNREGTGLGLPLTKQLAQLHGGSMDIESAPGFGTTVTLLLPSQGAPARPSPSAKNAKGESAEAFMAWA